MGHHTPPSLHRSGQPRIPLNTLAIGFGAAGLASLWTTVTSALRTSPIPSELLWISASIVWAWLIFAHLYRGRHSDETLRSQLRHPAQGPIAAIVPVIGMLIGAHLHQSWPVGGTILVLASIVTAALFAGWILAYWHTGRLTPEVIHGGYFLPTVAAALVGATTSYKVGFPMIAFGAFAVGIIFWVVILTVLLARLAFFPPLPGPLTPTLAIILAPPAVAGTAWFALHGERADGVSQGLLGVTVLMLLLQLFLVPVYRRVPFNLGFWSVTFPVGAAATYLIQWLSMASFAGWQIVALTVAGVASALTLAIVIRSLVLVSAAGRRGRFAENTLRQADDKAEGS
ncbi:transporter [Lacisediminihabitans sp. H27-G8]|uniref:SLAC1 family transporter n=1 Tax=Lacisediminihabitans sp. H27-G8 TaxID=3111909 RepID=UPI0038FC389B